jgi:ribosomal protein S18 acetylase RimI-like enzyme
MIIAEKQDKQTVIDILVRAFEYNPSANYIVKQDHKKKQRLAALMDYSFEYCLINGQIYLSNDKKACALIVYPEKVHSSLKSLLISLNLIVNGTGLKNLKKAIQREAKIKELHASQPVTRHLWFIGVDPSVQKSGKGSLLLQELLSQEYSANDCVLLETSIETNLNWYKRFGFTLYNTLDFGYQLFCLKRVNS